MNRLRSTLGKTIVIITAALYLAGTASASVIWSATSPSSFQGVEKQDCSGNYGSNNGSSCTTVTDPVYGTVLKFHKDTNDRRCEGKGASGVTIATGQTYYLGWRFKQSSTVNDNCFFQWKSYGSPMNQNYPFVIKIINGQLTVQYYPPNSSGVTVLYSQPISANTWYDHVLMITTSSSETGGRFSYWIGGVQKVNNFVCKSFDGDTINPKWGKYGACGTSIDSYVGQLKIGTTYADVALSGSGGGGGTTVSFEAENLAVSNSGVGTSVQSDVNSSNGKWIELMATSAGSWMEFTTGTVQAGTYSASMMWKGNTTRGITDFFVDGVQVGGTLDQYSSAQTYPTTTFGTVTFGSSGTHKIRMHVTGKNSASTNYQLSADKFTFTAQ